ncbi:hypothetical protein L0337_39940 [candidate division KSB1 bacterium]|nr:hypothetical protein [candidate division KSB1 bacterium]
MTTFAIGSVLAGAVFGRFFKVWGLVPALSLVFVIVFSLSAYYGHGLPRALVEFAAFAVCLQFGYVSGPLLCVIRRMWQRPRPPREVSRPAATL